LIDALSRPRRAILATIAAMGLGLPFVSFRTDAAPGAGTGAGAGGSPDPSTPALQATYRDIVEPFLRTYCLECHGQPDPEADLDLSAYPTWDAAARDPRRWEAVLEQLQAKSMPPARAKRRPEAGLRREVIAWIEGLRAHEARRHAGDPGRALARRLSNAEYDNTIRDLTGVDIRPTRDFPVDPANPAGFDNSAESLAMSPALLKKYLQAARSVADHLVLKPGGLDFAPHPVRADTDRDKYCVQRIIEFYRRHKTDYADYFLAAWRFQHRAALGKPAVSLADLAAEEGLSARYLATIWTTLTATADDAGPIAALQALWRALPPAPVPGDGDGDGHGPPPEAVRTGCERMREFVIQLRRQLTPHVKNLTAPGLDIGSQPLVLWKNRQLAANRMRYTGGASQAGLDPRMMAATPGGAAAAQALVFPPEVAAIGRYEATFRRFCATFPDAFFVSERTRPYMNNALEDRNTGRLLTAGFHLMTGYFRDDAPLSALLLDPREQAELDALWHDFDVITTAPIRQYTSFVWFERTESTFLRDPKFDFARAEDRDVTSEALIARLATAYLAKARAGGASALALQAIEDHFRILTASIRRVEQARRAAEPGQIAALQEFAGRAFRRPLSTAERLDVAAFYRARRDRDGLTHEEAVQDTLVRVLMSPHFCYRVDLLAAGPVSASAPGGMRPLSDFALASRLSYFLWSSMPDDELMARAAAGDLHDPEVLVAQARRMLRDGRARALATEFLGNWLDFRRFEEHNGVDRRRFPAFNDALRAAMFEEPIRFFVDLVREDRPVLELLDADHTFVNPVLARHYGLPEPGPDRWVRVDGARRFGRGGLLPMAVFLTRNAPGLRTSPVKRGYWVVRRLLGEDIPPPPAEVPELPEDEARLGDLTLRETLVRHRADARCAGCHERFDSIGLAFEGYGPIGELRTIDLGGRPVDTRVTFPRGVEGAGVEGLRTYLHAARQGEFLENLCRKLLAYALGRSLLPSDHDTIRDMRDRLAADGHRFGSLVETIVSSPQFRNTRAEGDRAEE
jgi:hypothetical protein